MPTRINYPDGLAIDGVLQLKSTISPTINLTGYYGIYPKEDGKLYIKNSLGVESRVGIEADWATLLNKPVLGTAAYENIETFATSAQGLLADSALQPSYSGSSNITTVGTLVNLTVTNPITGSVSGNAATVTDGVYTTGVYANPSWLSSLAWAKLTSTPTTLSGYGITDAQPLNTDLTLISDLTVTNGYLRKVSNSEWELVAGVDASLVNFSESTSVFNTRVTTALTAISEQTNTHVAIVAKGSGGLCVQVAEGTELGGNSRGIHTVDLQSLRGNADEVASGSYSCILGGIANKASGIYSVVLGGNSNVASFTYATAGGGTSNTASGLYSTAIGGAINTASGNYSAVIGGEGNIASGIYSIAQGYSANTFNRMGFKAFSSGSELTSGDAQSGAVIHRNRTVDITPTALTSDSNLSITTSNIYVLQNGQATFIKGRVIANQKRADGLSRKVWEFNLAAYRGLNVSEVTVDAFDSIVIFDSGVSWSISAVADTTVGGVYISVVGEASTNIQWVASLDSVECIYNFV